MQYFLSSLTRRLPSLAVSSVLLASIAFLPACAAKSPAGNDPTEVNEAEIPDPFEGVNRAVFGVNQAADILFISPAATIYREGVPRPIRTVARNFIDNLELPVIAINKLLQGDLDGFGTALARFGVNSTIGVAGFVDVATDMSLPHEETDFGVTLAGWGVPPTAYVVLPLLGPSSVRDGIGRGVDYAMDPVRIAADELDVEGARRGVTAVKVLDSRGQADGVIQDVRKNSLDSYATMRSLYSQHRNAEVERQLNDDDSAQELSKPLPADE